MRRSLACATAPAARLEKNAKTPTLILPGENDTTDRLEQSQQLYRAVNITE
jgi:alpha-beta hydrolase superfamily lysophospholipase